MAAGTPAARPSQEEGLPASRLRWDLPGLKGAETKGRQGGATDLWGDRAQASVWPPGANPPLPLRGAPHAAGGQVQASEGEVGNGGAGRRLGW